jgi:hypothetical protein
MPKLAVDTFSSRRLDLSRYDKTPGFSQREQLRVAAVAEGESLHLRLDDPLARLLDPLKACLLLTKAQPSQHSLLRHLVAEMHATHTVFWTWREEAWTSVYHRCDFYVPGDSTRAQALEASTHNQRLLEQIPVTETERKALAGDQLALQQLLGAYSAPVS